MSKELLNLLDKIEGCAGIIESRNRSSLIYSGELMELDVNDYKPVQPVFAILLNDALIISSILQTSSRNQKKYKYQTLFELDNLAVVNVKDPNFKTAFKILMFPTTRVFKTDSIQIKKLWLDSFENAKKQRKASLTLQRRDSLMYISNVTLDGSATAGAKTPMSPMDRPYSSILNPFEEAELLEASESDAETLPLWLTELPEDLDVLIAQRNFEEAVKLALKVQEHFNMYPKCCDTFMQADLKLRIDNKIKELIDAIANELQIAPDRSLQTGPRSSRRAVYLLLRLGKSAMATRLFLNQRSALLKFILRQQKIEGATLQYIKRMSSVFFNNIKETCKEFQKAFDMANCGTLNGTTNSLLNDNVSVNSEKLSGNSLAAPATSCLISWTRNQLSHFVGLFTRHVFTPQVSPSIAAECVALIRHYCSKLRNAIGFDLTYYLDKQLKSDIERIILDSRDKLLEAIKLRSSEENWHPQNLGSKPRLAKFIEELKDSGIVSINSYIYDEYRVSLSSNTTSFAKSYLNMLKDLLKLSTPFTHNYVIETLVVTFRAEMKHIDQSLRSDQFRTERNFILRNAIFLIDTLLTLCEHYYCEKFSASCEALEDLRKEFQYLRDGNVGSVEKKRVTPTKYTAYL